MFCGVGGSSWGACKAGVEMVVALDRCQIAERNYTQGLFREENRKPFFVGVSPPVLEAVSANQELFTQFAWADQISLQRKTEDFIEEEGGHVVSPNFFHSV